MAGTSVAATIVGFDVAELGRGRQASGPSVWVVLRLPDGARRSVLVSADEASRCRIGAQVVAAKVTTRIGYERIVVSSSPCR